MLEMVVILIAIALASSIVVAGHRRTQDQIRELQDQLDNARDESGGMEAIREELSRLQSNLEKLPVGDQIEKLARQVRDLGTSVRNMKDREPGPGQPSFTECIETELLRQGYHSVEFLIDLPEKPWEDSDTDRVPLKAQKEGVAYKGFARIEDGTIVETKLQPAYGVFP